MSDESVTREWLIQVLGEEHSVIECWKIAGACGVFSIKFHDCVPPILAVSLVSAGLHPVCDLPATRSSVLQFMNLVGVKRAAGGDE